MKMKQRTITSRYYDSGSWKKYDIPTPEMVPDHSWINVAIEAIRSMSIFVIAACLILHFTGVI